MVYDVFTMCGGGNILKNTLESSFRSDGFVISFVALRACAKLRFHRFVCELLSNRRDRRFYAIMR